MKGWLWSYEYEKKFLFETAKVGYITAMIILHLILHSAVHTYDVHIWFAPSWLVRLIGRALHRYRRSQGFESRTSLNFFQAFFWQRKSCVYNCDDHPSFNCSLRSSHIWFSYIHNFIDVHTLGKLPLSVPEEGSVWSTKLKGNPLAQNNYLGTPTKNSSNTDVGKLSCDKESKIIWP